jgi:DNA-binding CsgD family transcriptional regulator
MSSLFARCIGLSQHQQISMDAAILLLERRTTLSRSEARVVVLDYLGWPRDQMCEHLGVSVETIRTYWKRIYRKTNLRTRTALRGWLEALLAQEIDGGMTP